MSREFKAYTCPKCGRSVYSITGEKDALRTSYVGDEKVCAYCKSEDSLYAIDLLGIDDIEDQIRYMNESTIISGNFIQKDDIIHCTVNGIEIVAYTIDSKHVNEISISENFYKELVVNIGSVDKIEDCNIKLVALEKLKTIENTDEYNDDISVLKKTIEDITKEHNKYEEIAKKYESEALGYFENFLDNCNILDGFQKDEYIEQSLEVYQNIEEGIFEFDGNRYDMSQIWINEFASVRDSVLSMVYNYFSYQLIVLNFEFWRISNEESYLEDALKRIKNFFESNYSKVNYKYCLIEYTELRLSKIKNPIDLLKAIVDELKKFHDYFERDYMDLIDEESYEMDLVDLSVIKSFIPREVTTLPFEEYGRPTDQSLIYLTLNFYEICKLLQIMMELMQYRVNASLKALDKKSDKYKQKKWDKQRLRKISSGFKVPYEDVIKLSTKVLGAKDDIEDDSESKALYLIKTVNSLLEEVDEQYKEVDLIEKISDLKTSIRTGSTDYVFLEKFDFELDKFVRITEKQIMKNARDSKLFGTSMGAVENLLEKVKNKIKDHDDVSNSLATAEYLYSKYVIDSIEHQEERLMNYAFISVMYYSVLERILNEILFAPYYYEMKCADLNRYSDESVLKKYLRIDGSSNVYFSNNVLKSSLTLGQISHLFSFENKGDMPSQMKVLFQRLFKGFDSDYHDLYMVINDISDIAKRRNLVAHGAEIVNVVKVIDDRNDVYEMEKAKDCKKVLVKFIQLLK